MAIKYAYPCQKIKPHKPKPKEKRKKNHKKKEKRKQIKSEVKRGCQGF